MYQDIIYNSNGSCSRNSTIRLPNTSSDICIYEIPFFQMTGASKIDCSEVTCDISGVSYNDIYTATTECFTTYGLSGTCFDNIVWETRVLEDNDLVYSATFFTSTAITGSSPTISNFSGSVVTAFNTLGYDYSFSGTQYTLYQKGFNNLKLQIRTDLNLTDDCPPFTGSCSAVTEVICDLDFSGLTSGSTNVYPLTGQTNINLDFTFTANTKSLTGDTEFNFEIYKYNKDLGVFTQPSIYQSRAFTWNEFSGTSAFTTSVPISNLSVDGDYLVKGYYNYDICTEILSLLGEKRNTAQYKYGDKYSLYKQDRDFHFVAFTSAETPFLNPGNPISPELNTFTIGTFIVNEGQTDYNIQTAESDYLISLNGLTLSKNLDYSISSNTLTTVLKLSATTVPGDIITYAFLNSTTDNSAIRLDVFDITSKIVSGATDGQGSNNVYYNTTKGKYEIYTSVTPSNGNDIVINLNGVTLGNNIDYYLSTSNPKRIILEGNLVVGDILNLYYVSNTDVQGDIDTTSISVSWSIQTPPQAVNGEFILELSDNENFTNIINTGQTDYVVGSTNYNNTLNLTGSVGDVQYYRVKNIKKYEDICGNLIYTTTYSEIIDITIQTNAINSY